MSPRIGLVLPFAAACLLAGHATPPSPACCPAPPSGKPVVNADQTVVILWDAATKTEHFIRRASFKSAADDFGFLIPSPTRPDLNESGNDAFPYLEKLTEELRAICREHLAPYEVPKLFEFADALPRSPLGKLLKRELRKSVNGNAVLSAESRINEKRFDKDDDDESAEPNGNGNGSSKKNAGKKEVA